MNYRNWGKLAKAGYIFYRLDEHNKTIKIKSYGPHGHGWAIWKRFETKKAMNAAFDDLIKNDETALSV